MVQTGSCDNLYSRANTQCRAKIPREKFKNEDVYNKTLKACEEEGVMQFKEECKDILKKAEEKCEKKAKQEFDEKKEGIGDECNTMVKETAKLCKILPECCIVAPAKCSAQLASEYNKEMIKEVMQCRYGEGFIELGNRDKLFTKEILDAFYKLTDNKDTLEKIANGTYFVRQFGIDVKNLDNGKHGDDPVTYTGNIDKSCFFNTSGNSSDTESYGIKKETNDYFRVGCHNKIFAKDTYLQIVKAVKGYSDIENCKPLVTVSQKEPLMIANSENGKLVTKDGTITNYV